MPSDATAAERGEASVPITLLTGFLGSGKTTLCNTLVRRPSMRDALVLVNEVGEASVDHHLVEEIDERVVVLPSGCVCCALRDDLVAVLGDRELTRGRGRVIVETSGLADPTPLIGTIVRHPVLSERFHVGEVVVALDALRARALCSRFPEAAKQLALADVVVITKCDRASAEQVCEAEELARQICPEAAIRYATRGEIDRPEWPARANREIPSSNAHAHTHGIRTFTVESDARTSFKELAAWLSMMSQLNGDRFLRFKGLVRVTDQDDPVVVQSVQHVVYPSYTLPRWPDDAPRTKLVGITQGMSDRLHDDVVASLQKIVG